MGEARKLHHTVPKFSLRGFADHREWITTVRLPGEKSYTQSIDKSAAINHFYSIDGHPDGPDVFEKALSDLEGSAATVFRAIEVGEWPLSEEQRATLAMFLAVQALCGPDHRRSMEYLAAQITRLEVEFTGRENVNRWVGLVMSDIKPMIETGYPVEQVRAGHLDSVERGTTAFARFINERTVCSASEYVYRHPDDGAVLPDRLPDSRLSNLSIAGQGEPGFRLPAE